MILIALVYESEEIFIFYDYKKQITCVGADDGQTLGPGFVDSTPVTPYHDQIGRASW